MRGRQYPWGIVEGTGAGIVMVGEGYFTFSFVTIFFILPFSCLLAMFYFPFASYVINGSLFNFGSSMTDVFLICFSFV